MPSQTRERYEDAKSDLVINNFLGVNTQATRTSISENEFAWLENMMPIGEGNMRAVPYQSGILATVPSGNITYWKYFNINGTDYLFAATSTLGAYVINLTTYAITLAVTIPSLGTTTAIAQWKNERILIVSGTGYWSWDPIGGLVVLGGTTGAPSSGATIETFAGRVWISLGRTVSFSAPNSYTDFTTSSSGGSFIISDSTLHSNINAMIAANNFLYIFGDSSINVISDVRVGAGTPAPTLYSNTNISSLIGSTFPLSIFPYYRSIAFATRYGFYALTGASPQKISNNLDGIFPLIDFTKPVSGCVAPVFNILCAGFMFNYKDPAGARPLGAFVFNDKWFFISQGSGLTMMAGAFLSGSPVIFATDGPNIYQLFSNSTHAISTKIQSALWNFRSPTRTKQVLKHGIEVTTTSLGAASINTSIDTDIANVPTVLSGSNTGPWFNAAGVADGWINAVSTVGQWYSSGFTIFQGDAGGAYGRYIGMTLTSTTPGYILNGLMMQYETRANWNAL